MPEIDPSTTAGEIACLVSQALESAKITATLSGGGAVTLYSDNEYESGDLDFVTTARMTAIAAALEPLGFTGRRGVKHLEHPGTDYYVEFPPGPLAFGETVVRDEDTATIDTPFGPLRIVTPTQCVMDRLTAYVHWTDNQSFDQAVMVARRQPIDWSAIETWARAEGIGEIVVRRLRQLAERD